MREKKITQSVSQRGPSKKSELNARKTKPVLYDCLHMAQFLCHTPPVPPFPNFFLKIQYRQGKKVKKKKELHYLLSEQMQDSRAATSPFGTFGTLLKLLKKNSFLESLYFHLSDCYNITILILLVRTLFCHLLESCDRQVPTACDVNSTLWTWHCSAQSSLTCCTWPQAVSQVVALIYFFKCIRVI